MRKSEILDQIKTDLRVNWVGTCQWCVSSWVRHGYEAVQLYFHTHDEEYNTGYFNGEKYNFLCGFSSMEQLEQEADFCDMTVEEYQEKCWQDSANEDNYEPTEQYRERLTQELYERHEEMLMNWIGIEDDITDDAFDKFVEISKSIFYK